MSSVGVEGPHRHHERTDATTHPSDRTAQARALQAARHLRGPWVFCDAKGQRLSEKDVGDHVDHAARKAGLKERGIHILRHNFCSHLAMRGAPTRAIQELAGHADLKTTQRYMHLSPAALEGAIRLLDQGRGRENFVDIVETDTARIVK